MRASLTQTLAVSLAALVLGAAVVGVTPASANPWPHHHHGFWGPAVGIGILGLAAGAAYAASEENCVEYRPVYDRWGHFIGRQPINVCQ